MNSCCVRGEQIVARVTILLAVGMSVPAFAADAAFNIVSIPASMPVPEQLIAEVEFKSDGYEMQRCQVVKSSGDPIADSQACKTVSFKLTSKPFRAAAPVWRHDAIAGNYVMAASKSHLAPVTPYDYPSESVRRREQGTTVLRIDVNDVGAITRCDVAATSGF